MTMQKDIGILYNPRAGRQRASQIMEKVSVYFTAKGRRVRVRESSRQYRESDLSEYLDSLESLIVIGGDGTIRPLLPRLANVRLPVILFPAGNESLISKQFSVPKNIPDLFEKVVRAKTEEHYFAYAGAEPFFLMCSMGFDSEIVKNVVEARSGGSSNLFYVTGGLKALLSYQARNGSLVFDGETKKAFSGPIIIGNSPYYASNFLPVAEANSKSQEFAVRVFNEERYSTILNWIYAAVMRTHLSVQNSSIFYLDELDLSFEKISPVQVDGDYLGDFGKLAVRKSEERVLFLV